MILVDTSIWIDHFHNAIPLLAASLEADLIGSHDFVIQELALGSLRNRFETLGLLANLYRFQTLTHSEIMMAIDGRKLNGRGLGAVDAHLLATTLAERGSVLWSRDKRLKAAAEAAGVAYDEVHV